tara:strand:+ start:94 stop:558 length:465 start_codon:yes stop_codon:yes gene_type:complete
MLEDQELDGFKKDFYNQILAAGGRSEEQAKALVAEYLENRDEILKFKETVEVPRLLPIRFMQQEIDASRQDNLTEDDDINSLLFGVGFDTENHSWVIDICCYRWDGKVECGKVILGSERLDKDWIGSGNSSEFAFSYANRELSDQAFTYISEDL